MWNINTTDLEFNLNGYQYRTYLEVEDDNQKLFHHCFLNGNEVKMEKEFYNHSPYETMPYEVFKQYVHQLEVWMQL